MVKSLVLRSFLALARLPALMTTSSLTTPLILEHMDSSSLPHATARYLVRSGVGALFSGEQHVVDAAFSWLYTVLLVFVAHDSEFESIVPVRLRVYKMEVLCSLQPQLSQPL